MGVEEYVVDTMYSVASDVVKNAGYDKTIQAQVISCQDATIGKYRCRYQDAVFYAYSSNIDLMLSNNAMVYILVPNGDFKQEKTILGTTQKLGINYISQIEEEDGYQKIGIDCINSNNIYYLNSNNQNYQYTLYRHANEYNQDSGIYAVGDYIIHNGRLYECITAVTSPQSFNSSYWTEIENESLDVESLEQYIQQSSSMILGATFKTSIPANRQYQGHYGLRFNLVFKDNASGDIVTRSYQINEDNMVGNPYRLAYATRQYQVFDIDSENFLRVDSIEIFNNNFPNIDGSTSTGKLSNGDIQISKIELTNALPLSEDQLNGVVITFFTPQGTFFTNRSTTGDQKKIVAQVRVKGKLVSSAQNIPFYWGKENVNIAANNLSYNKHLGRGWECLNEKNVIQQEGNDPIVEWVQGTDTIVVSYDEATAQDNRYKVAILYDKKVITKEINIKNLSSIIAEVKITSDSGNKFYFDNGHPSLECSVFIDGVKQSSGNYTFYWAYESSEGVFNELPQTTEANSTYNFNKNAKETIEQNISEGQTFRESQRDDLAEIQRILNSYNFIQRVEDNHVYNVQIKNIKKFGTFKCSVFNAAGTLYFGTASHVLINSYDAEGVYSLVINNGEATFKYDENGFSPVNGSLDNPQQIQALSFTLYDNLGNPLDSNQILTSPRCSVEWGFPVKDTLLENVTAINGNPNGRVDQTGKYVYYKNSLGLVYNIANNYHQDKKVNQITLDVDYKGIKLSTQTRFTFLKEGQPGTNGTDYVIKLVPNTGMDDPPKFPIITTVGNNVSHYLNYGIGVANLATSTPISIGPGQLYEYQFFRIQIWKDGECVWEGFQAGEYSIINQHNDNNTTIPSSVNWEVLKNTYKRKNQAPLEDESDFGITSDGALDGNIYYKGSHLKLPVNNQTDAFTNSSANIIKCSVTINNKTYYGTIPITTAWVPNEDYKLLLKDYTGFRYVIYSFDGVNPKYDSSHPFEFVCKKNINNVEVDISTVAGNQEVTYDFYVCGDIWSVITQGSTSSFEKTNQNLLIMRDRNIYHLADNQVKCEPIKRYDGFCVNAAVLCQCSQGNTVIGRINVPIHFLLNKYGFANLNDWDGNHIQINNQSQQGYILTPQMGAGKKDPGNGFTGVLMGTVSRTDRGRGEEDTGLMGYSNGDRSFFLNSKNGSAIFGKGTGGKIIIDPSDEIEQIVKGTTVVQVPRNRALLYSDSFWKDYNKDGLPTSYYSSNYSIPGAGMLIDLSTPEIRWGNGNFSVNENGHIFAKGGGQIAGWLINDYDLTAKDGSITMHSSELTDPSLPQNPTTNPYIPARFYTEYHTTLTDTDQGFFLSQNGLSIGSMFKVTSDGTVRIGRGAVDESNSKHWIITNKYANNTINPNESYIAYNTNYYSEHYPNNVSNPTAEGMQYAPSESVYIGTDGISLGQKFALDNTGNIKIRKGSILITGTGEEQVFSVNEYGYLQARSGKIAEIQMHKNGQVYQLRAGTKSANNAISNGFVLQSNGRVLGVGSTYTVDQITFLTDYINVLLMPDATAQERAAKQAEKEAFERMGELLEDPDYDPNADQIYGNRTRDYLTVQEINIWEFHQKSGIFRGGHFNVDPSNGNGLTPSYRLTNANENFRIQPANGYARFCYVDVINQLAFGGQAVGFKNRSYFNMHLATDSQRTVLLDAENGLILGDTLQASSAVRCNYIDTNQNPLHIGHFNGNDFSPNGTIAFQTVLTNSNGLHIDANGQGTVYCGTINTSGNSLYIGSQQTVGTTTSFVANGTINCGRIIPAAGDNGHAPLFIGSDGYGRIKFRQIDTTHGTLQIGAVDSQDSQFKANGTIGCGQIDPYNPGLYIGPNGNGTIYFGRVNTQGSFLQVGSENQNNVYEANGTIKCGTIIPSTELHIGATGNGTIKCTKIVAPGGVLTVVDENNLSAQVDATVYAVFG